MRLSPVVKSGMTGFRKNLKASPEFFTPVSVFFTVALFAEILLFAKPSFAQAQPAYGQGANAAANNPQATAQAFMDTLSAMQRQQQPAVAEAVPDSAPMPQYSSGPNLGNSSDPDSDAYKVNQVALKAKRQRDEEAAFSQQNPYDAGLDQEAPPPDMTVLQQVHQSQTGAAESISDDPVSKGLSLDMRRSAQREAALSYGARGGLAKRNFEIMERMKGFETVLDRVFDFRALLIKAPSGLLIEPPIIKESNKAVVVTNEGDEAAVADKVFDINKKAKIITAPRDWRQYLIQSWSKVPPPPRVLWPQGEKEQVEWEGWVTQGWQAGIAQADEIFEANVNHLVAEYNGMVRYKMLLAQEMITAPYAMYEDRGVKGDTNQMRVGDRAIRITGPSQFLTKANLWKPANQ
jgi:defect-in-organelle-trafficking protein DotC